MTKRKRKPIPDRLWPKATNVGGEGCWLWTASMFKDGYGKFRVGDTHKRAHRVAYEIMVGPIPDGLQIDHLCRNRACINPKHLEAVTGMVNFLRGESLGARAIRTGKCMKGHSNWRQYKRARYCRECDRIRTAAKRAR